MNRLCLAPWKPDLAGERCTKLLDMIVGFEIEITDVLGKFKLSQNRPAEDRQRVIEALSQSLHPLGVAVTKLMKKANRCIVIWSRQSVHRSFKPPSLMRTMRFWIS